MHLWARPSAIAYGGSGNASHHRYRFTVRAHDYTAVPHAKEVQQQREVDALARVGEHVEAILDGTFNLIALNALKLKKDLKIVFERDEPLYGLLLYKFTQHCSQQVSKSSFLTSVRAIAVRCDFHVDGLVSVATDIWNEAKQASPTGEPNKRVNFRAGHKRSFGEATSE